MSTSLSSQLDAHIGNTQLNIETNLSTHASHFKASFYAIDQKLCSFKEVLSGLQIQKVEDLLSPEGTISGIPELFPLHQLDISLQSGSLELKKEADGFHLQLEFDAEFQVGDDILIKIPSFKLLYNPQDQWQVNSSAELQIWSKTFECHCSLQWKDSPMLQFEIQISEASELFQIENLGKGSVTQLTIQLATHKKKVDWGFTSVGELCFNPLEISEDGLRIEKGTFRKIFGKKAIEFSGNIQTPRITYPSAFEPGKGLSAGIRQHSFGLEIDFKKLYFEVQNGQWTFSGAADIIFHGLPYYLKSILQTDRFEAHASYNKEKGVAFGVNLLPEALVIPDLFQLAQKEIGSAHFSLPPIGETAVRLLSIDLKLHKAFYIDIRFGVALPSKLNEFLQFDKLPHPAQPEKKGIPVFKTYLPNNPEQSHYMEFALQISSKNIGGTASQWPIDETAIYKALGAGNWVREISEGERKGWIALDFTPESEKGGPNDLGCFYLCPPSLKINFENGSLQAGGAYAIDEKRGFKIPLLPLKALLKLLQLEQIGDKLPKGIPVKSIRLQDHGQIKHWLEELQIPIPKELESFFDFLTEQFDKLPNRFKEYLEISIPQSFAFDINITADGGFNIHIDTSGSPLSFLIPHQLPQLMGIKLEKLALGVSMGGALIRLDLKADIDQFDLLELSTCFLPIWEEESLKKFLPERAEMHQTIRIHDLLLLIIYETAVPIPIPIFFDIHSSACQITGAEGESRITFPRPKLQLMECLTFLSQAIKVCTKEEEIWDVPARDTFFEEYQPNQAWPVLALGPMYSRLPKMLGTESIIKNGKAVEKGKMLGFDKSYAVANPYDIVKISMNVFKLMLGKGPKEEKPVKYLIQRLKLPARVGSEQFRFLDDSAMEVNWAITSPEEFDKEVYEYLMQRSKNVLRSSNKTEMLSLISETAPSPTDADGFVLFLHGGIRLAGIAQMETAFAFRTAIGQSLQSGLLINGRLKDILSFHIQGQMNWAAHQDLAFDGELKLHLHLFNQNLLNGAGSVQWKNNAFSFSAKLNILPNNPSFSVWGGIAGHISNSEFLIDTKAHIRLLNTNMRGHVYIHINGDQQVFRLSGALDKMHYKIALLAGKQNLPSIPTAPSQLLQDTQNADLPNLGSAPALATDELVVFKGSVAPFEYSG